jgi:hypothetical protein
LPFARSQTTSRFPLPLAPFGSDHDRAVQAEPRCGADVPNDIPHLAMAERHVIAFFLQCLDGCKFATMQIIHPDLSDYRSL